MDYDRLGCTSPDDRHASVLLSDESGVSAVKLAVPGVVRNYRQLCLDGWSGVLAGFLAET